MSLASQEEGAERNGWRCEESSGELVRCQHFEFSTGLHYGGRALLITKVDAISNLDGRCSEVAAQSFFPNDFACQRVEEDFVERSAKTERCADFAEASVQDKQYEWSFEVEEGEKPRVWRFRHARLEEGWHCDVPSYQPVDILLQSESVFVVPPYPTKKQAGHVQAYPMD